MHAHIDGELPAHPHQLAGVGLQLLDTALVDLAHVDGVAAQGIDDIEVMAEHVGVLVVLLGDVLLDWRGKRHLCRLPERKRQVGAAWPLARHPGPGAGRGDTHVAIWRLTRTRRQRWRGRARAEFVSQNAMTSGGGGPDFGGVRVVGNGDRQVAPGLAPARQLVAFTWHSDLARHQG